MKTIRIFLASSEEMDYDRMVFGNLVRRLDDVYEKRGIRLKLFEWEDYDSAFNDRRKQDEYNEKVKESDIFLALFHKKAGQFTVEEFDVASQAFKEKASPKVYAYLRDLQEGEEASPELEEFKHRLFDEMGHYWCRYDNRDSLQLQFVMQLQLVENNVGDSLKVEDGEVRIDGMKVASMDCLQFAAGNEDYLKMSEELAALPAKIEKARIRLEKFPDDEDLADDLQQKLNRNNELKEEFAEYQKLLFNTAKRVAQLQGERVTDRMRRAMDAFNEGKVREANIILDEAEADAKRNLEDYKQSKEITELKRQPVISSIKELLLKTSTIMADVSIPIEDRITQTDALFNQIDEMVQEADYDEEKYAEHLYDHGGALLEWISDKALLYFELSLRHTLNVQGENHPDIARCYNGIGLALYYQGEYAKAIENHVNALIIRRGFYGEKHAEVADSYYCLGECYKMLQDYSRAIEYYQKALDINKELYGHNHPDTAECYHEMGYNYDQLEEYPKALECYLKAVEIRERVLGKSHLCTSFTYSALGDVYSHLSDYSNAVIYYEKALQLMDSESDTVFIAMYHENIGDAYTKIGLYSKALEQYKVALLNLKRFWEDDEAEDVVGMQKKINEMIRLMNV